MSLDVSEPSGQLPKLNVESSNLFGRSSSKEASPDAGFFALLHDALLPGLGLDVDRPWFALNALGAEHAQAETAGSQHERRSGCPGYQQDLVERDHVVGVAVAERLH